MTTYWICFNQLAPQDGEHLVKRVKGRNYRFYKDRPLAKRWAQCINKQPPDTWTSFVHTRQVSYEEAMLFLWQEAIAP